MPQSDTDATDEFSLAATGDSIITRPVLPLEGRSDRFDDVVATLRAADATVTNLELVINDRGSYATPPPAVADQYQYLSSFPGMVMRADPAILDDLTAIGIDLFSTANNHSHDFGRRGMERTMRALESRNLTYAGLGRDLADARAPGYLSSPGGRVGLVHACASVPPGGEAGTSSAILPGRPGINPLHVHWTYKVPEDRLESLREIAALVGIEDVKDTWLKREDRDRGADGGFSFMHMTFVPVDSEAEAGIELSLDPSDRNAVVDQIREADAQADWVVATVHSHQGPHGTRNIPRTPEFIESFARECVDAGADAVVCTGPHVLRGIELYDDRPIFYSLGNFFCQIETQDQLPAEAFDFYGVETDDRPSALMDARYLADGEPRGNLAYPEYWRTVVPTCHFDPDGSVRRVELLPCSVGRRRPRAQRGTPKRARSADADRILENLRDLSSTYGTTIERDGSLFVIEPQ